MKKKTSSPYKLWPLAIVLWPIILILIFHLVIWFKISPSPMYFWYLLLIYTPPVSILAGIIYLGYSIFKGCQWFSNFRFPIINQILSVGLYLTNFSFFVFPNIHVNTVGFYQGLTLFSISGIYMLLSTLLLNSLIKREEQVAKRWVVGLLIPFFIANLLISFGPFALRFVSGNKYASMIEKAYADRGQFYTIKVDTVNVVDSDYKFIEYTIINQDIKQSAALKLTDDMKGIEKATFTSPLDQPWQIFHKQASSDDKQKMEKAIVEMVEKGIDEARMMHDIKLSTLGEHSPSIFLNVSTEGELHEQVVKPLPDKVKQIMDANVKQGQTAFQGLPYVPFHVLLEEEVIGVIIHIDNYDDSFGDENNLPQEKIDHFVSKLDWSQIPNGNYQINYQYDYHYNFKVVDGKVNPVENFPFRAYIRDEDEVNKYGITDMTEWSE